MDLHLSAPHHLDLASFISIHLPLSAEVVARSRIPSRISHGDLFEECVRLLKAIDSVAAAAAAAAAVNDLPLPLDWAVADQRQFRRRRRRNR